jgi:TolA-binding protein
LAHRIPLALVAVGLLVAGGCTGAQTRPDKASFDAGYAAFQDGRWQAAVDGFTRYLNSDPSSKSRGEVFYYRGEALMHLGRKPDAMTDFRHAVTSDPGQPILAYAYTAIGNAYYEGGDDAKAIQAYAEAIKGPQDKLPMDMLLMRLGAALQRTGQWGQADRYLAIVIERYPGAPAFVEAQRRYRADSFSIQIGAFTSQPAVQQAMQQARAAGFTPRLGQTRRGSQVMTTVLIGKADTYADAQALAKKVAGAGMTALIVP